MLADAGSADAAARSPAPTRLIVGDEARSFDWNAKWALLSPHLVQHGGEALSYATLQQGMEYFVHELGYLAFVTVTHPVFARKPKSIVLSDPVCAPGDMRALIEAFLRQRPRAVFGVISERCAAVLHDLAFKVNVVGYEPELSVPTYNTAGNWKELDLVKRARNEARREGIAIREVDIRTVPRDQLDALTSKWIGGKKVNDREIWIYARRPVYDWPEEGVRKFVAFDRSGTAIGYAFYDPMYRGGRVFGYSANTVRCDEQRYGRLATAIHMTAMDVFKTEGVEILNLLLCPFAKLAEGRFNDDAATRMFFQISERYGNEIYNFKGLAFHKSKYRGVDKILYFASNSTMPSNDVYLAFLSADIASSYFDTLGRLAKGVLKELRPRRRAGASSSSPPR